MGKENIGSSFDDFLKEDGVLEECEKEGIKKVEEYVNIEDTLWFKTIQLENKKHPIKYFFFTLRLRIVGNVFWRPVNYIRNRFFDKRNSI